MGTWGTGIYSNDIAEDVRDACKDIFAVYDTEDGNKLLFEHFADILEQSFVDNEYASFWYALADWQWKHGMLDSYVKEKALDLLETHAGMDEWYDDGDKADIRKRIKVLELLKEQLRTHQPVLKKPRLSLAKPKHKCGEIIVFRTDCSEPSVWNVESFLPTFMFKSLKLFGGVRNFDARGKYMALLCVGTDSTPHSAYLPNLCDTYSVYAWYDYLSEVEPSTADLVKCGFLPFVDLCWKDFNSSILAGAEWKYKFILYSETFRTGKEISMLKKYKILSERDRFNDLSSHKNYSSDVWGHFDLRGMFGVAFRAKNIMELLGETIDNLLDDELINPEFASSSEMNARYRKYIASI